MESAEVLSVLFDFVGKGHFLYVAGVSRSWRRHYTPKAEDEDGDLVTALHDAVRTISALEYAFSSGLQFTSDFHPEKDDFGPGVYGWARQHGFPLFVWVAFRTLNPYSGGINGVEGDVSGVFSSASKAKNGARSRWGYMNGASEWDSLGSDGFWFYCWNRRGRCRVSIMPFAVTGLAYADEIDPLPLYVTSRCSYEGFAIERVFATKELTNAYIKKLADQYAGFTTPTKDGMVCYTGESIVAFDIKLEGYLDG